MNYNTELLAPVGSMESLYAAIENGADAVYLGGKLFNARQFASNFDYEELKELIAYSHLNQVKVYVTVNILIDNNEIEKALDYVRFLYEEDVDAIIVQDFGFASKVRKLFPDLHLHASTQMTINNLEGVKLLEELGFKRVVLARETPLDEIKRIRKGSSIEIESFIHGALCVSYSGQCLMSSIIGGRSGNRGTCAQPCRMPYSIVDEKGDLLDGWQELHLLSPKDLNTLDYLESIIDAGVNSLKIEGRMKRPEYVATIVANYRKVIDEKHKPSKEEKEEVKQIFNRGFTKGVGLGDFGREFISMDRPDNRGTLLGKVINADRDYVYILLENDLDKDDGIEFSLVNGKYKGMKCPIEGKAGETITIKKIGNIRKNSYVYKTSSISLIEKAQKSYEGNKNIYPINMEIKIKIGEKPNLKYSYKDYTKDTSVDFIVEKAKNKGISEEKVKEQLLKLGDTQYSLKNIYMDVEENSFLPLSVLNELRREAVESLNDYLYKTNHRIKLEDKDYRKKKQEVLSIVREDSPATKALSVKVDKLEQISRIDLNKIDRIYIPLAGDYKASIEELRKKNIEIYISTEKILYEKELKVLEEKLNSIKDSIDGVSVENLGSLYFIKENYDLKIHGDFGLNIFNSYTIDALKSLGIEDMTVSAELNITQINKIEKLTGGSLEALVYGYLPVMTTITCPMALVKGCKDDKECQTCNFADGYGLNDRMDKTFYMSRKEGFTSIYNSVPIMVLDSMDQIYSSGINMGRLDFTIEKEAISSIQNAYYNYIKGAWDEKEARNFIEKIKDTTEITKGHFFRGVL